MMQKHIIFLFVCLLFSFGASAQLEVDFSTSDTPVPGGTVDIDVSVSNFDNIVSAQYFILWDSLVLGYDSVFNVTDQLEQFSIGNIGTPQTIMNGEDGEMTVSWSHSSTNPFSVPDNTVLFTVRMNVEGTDCDSTAVGIGNIPPFQNIEIINEDFEDIGANATPLPFALPGTDCESGGGANCNDGIQNQGETGIDCGGPCAPCSSGASCNDGIQNQGETGIDCGGPCAPCVNSTDLTLTSSNLSGDPGDNVCMSVTVDNFTDVLGLQGSMTWDPSVISFTAVENLAIDDIIVSSANAAAGTFSFLWFDNSTVNPENLPDGTTLFDVCFDLIGAAGSSTNVSFSNSPPLEFTDSNEDEIPSSGNTSTVSINGGGGGASCNDGIQNQGETGIDCGGPCAPCTTNSGQTITIQNTTVAPGATVCIPIIVTGFEDIQSVQGGLTWDDSVLSYTMTQNVNSDLSSLAFGQNGNSLSFVWFDDSGVNPVTLPDGSIMFEVCFTAIGSGSTQITFANNPPLEIANSSEETQDFTPIPATVTIGTPPPGGDFSFNCSNTALNEGSNDCIDITTMNFTDISAVQLSITWDASQLTYTEANNFDPTIGNVQFNQTGGNEVGLTWDSSNGQGVTVPDGTTMFSICFDVADCPMSNLTGNLNFVSGSQVPIEVGNGEAETVPTSFQPCPYNIIGTDCAGTICSVDFGTANISPPTCFGGEANGSIIVNPTISGAGCSITSCTWFQGVPGGAMIPSTDCNLTGVPSGDYFLVVSFPGGSAQMNYNIPVTPPLDITGQIFPVTCNALGGVNTTITGGSGVYNCLWPHNGAVGCNIGGLESGVYTLEIVDAITGCMQVQNFDIGIDHMIEAEASTSGADCGGGTISISVDQAGPWDYEWSHDPTVNSPVQNNLEPGAYTITVSDDDGDCSTIVTATVTATSSAVTIQNIMTTDASCNGAGGSADFGIVGGCLPYACMVEGPGGVMYPCDGLVNLPAGDYTISVSDASTNPGITGGFTVGSFEDIVVSVSTVNVDGGTPGQINTTVTGGEAPYSYNWSTTNGSGLIQGQANQTMVGEGTYDLTVTDMNGCTGVNTGIIIDDGGDPLPPVIGPGFITDEGCSGDCNGAFQASITGTGQLTYFVMNNDTGVGEEILELPAAGLCQGNYTLTVTDPLGQSDSVDFDISGTSDLQFVVDDSTCDDETNSGSLSISIDNLPTGATFLWSPSGDTTLNPEGLATGMHILTVSFGECIFSQAFPIVDCIDPGVQACGESSAVITPNNDGLNDLLQVSCAEDFPNTFVVYDRYGRVVYEAVDYSGNWDGVDTNGDIVTEGVYYWVMDSTFDSGERRIFKGYVNVVRETK